MGTNHYRGHCLHPKTVLVRQKRAIANDYPFFVVKVYQCVEGCNEFCVSLDKVDLGYTKNISKHWITSPLEAFVKCDKLIDECIDGVYDMLPIKEGYTFE